MSRPDNQFYQIILIMLTTGMSLTALDSYAEQSDIVYVEGTQENKESMLMGGPTIKNNVARATLCLQLSEIDTDDVMENLGEIRDEIPAIHDFIASSVGKVKPR